MKIDFFSHTCSCFHTCFVGWLVGWMSWVTSILPGFNTKLSLSRSSSTESRSISNTAAFISVANSTCCRSRVEMVWIPKSAAMRRTYKLFKNICGQKGTKHTSG